MIFLKLFLTFTIRLFTYQGEGRIQLNPIIIKNASCQSLNLVAGGYRPNKPFATCTRTRFGANEISPAFFLSSAFFIYNRPMHA